MRSRVVEIGSMMLALALVVSLVITTAGCGSEEDKTLTIYHAGSLAVPFAELESAFEADNSSIDVLLEGGGSATMISKSITNEEAGEDPPDIIASADYTLIPDRLYEDEYADWTIIFARNIMVLCYRDDAPFSDDIVNGERTWYDVLRNEDVTWGHSSPDDDPCGYRSLMVFQLAEEYYYNQAETFGLTPDEVAMDLYDTCIPGTDEERGRASDDKQVVRSKSVDLVELLQSGDLDYAFEYRSVAVQHDLNYVELDEAINLSQVGEIGDSGVTYADFYKEASVQLETEPGVYSEKTGKAIVYGITIPKNAPNLDEAVDFIKMLLSNTGKDVMETQNGQPMVEPPTCDNPDNLPSELADLVEEM